MRHAKTQREETAIELLVTQSTWSGTHYIISRTSQCYSETRPNMYACAKQFLSLSLLLACLHGVSGRGRDPQPSHGSATPVVLVRSWSLPLSLSLSFARAMVQGFDPPHRARSLSLSLSLSLLGMRDGQVPRASCPPNVLLGTRGVNIKHAISRLRRSYILSEHMHLTNDISHALTGTR